MILTNVYRVLLALLLFTAGVLVGLLCAPLPAAAACGSLPYVFTNHTSVVDANTTNANNNFLVGCATQVDHTQVGSAGIFASQILPTGTAAATFTSAYGWRLTSSSNTAVPVTIIQSGAPTVDTWAVYNNTLATKYVWVDAAGKLNTSAAPSFGAPLGVSSGGTGLSAFTANTCLHATGTTTIASASVDCITSATAPLVLTGSVLSLGTVPVSNGGTNLTTLAGGKCLRSASSTAVAEAAGDCVTAVTGSGPIVSGGGTTPAISCPTCQTGTRVKLAIGLGFNAGAVSTATVFPTQPIVAYATGQLTGIRAACSTVDNGTTVVTLSKNGAAIGTLTLSTSVVSSGTITTATIGAGDYLTFAITTAGTAQNCGFIAEGWQSIQ